MASHAGPALRAFLAALSPETKAAIGAAEIEIREFPFRVGRENRKMQWTDKGMRSERREPAAKPNNDLYLIETKEPMNVSREHFQIEREGVGFALVDRKSTCGTLVEGDVVGGQNRGGRVTLRDGDVVIVGASISPYVFKFRVQ
ncbi:MAG: FHA domain-containing protein [Acidobacteria bacterium]|nr:FHA domain-containing protein [Acidobacteriota bacterium]